MMKESDNVAKNMLPSRPNTNSGVPASGDFFTIPACDILCPVRSRFDTGGNLATAANALSALRIAAAPAVFFLIIRSGDGSSAAAVLVFMAAAFTDFLDGQMARRTASVSSMGRVLDPLADRIFIGSVVIALAVVGALPALGVALVVVRDIFLVLGYKFMERHGVTVNVSWLGKSYTAVFMAAIIAVMAGAGVAGGNIGLWLFWIAVAGSLVSGIIYVIRGLHLLQAAAAGK